MGGPECPGCPHYAPLPARPGPRCCLLHRPAARRPGQSPCGCLSVCPPGLSPRQPRAGDSRGPGPGGAGAGIPGIPRPGGAGPPRSPGALGHLLSPALGGGWRCHLGPAPGPGTLVSVKTTDVPGQRAGVTAARPPRVPLHPAGGAAGAPAGSQTCPGCASAAGDRGPGASPAAGGAAGEEERGAALAPRSWRS